MFGRRLLRFCARPRFTESKSDLRRESIMKAFALLTILLISSGFAWGQTKTSRELAGLKGPVKQVKVERTVVSERSGRETESERFVLSNVSYDRIGNMIRQMVNNQEGRLKWHFGWAYTYDPQGRPIKQEYYSAAGKLTNTALTHYDDMARKASVTHYNVDGSVNHIRELMLDEKSRLVHEAFRYPDGKGFQRSLSYNAHGNLLEEVNKEVDGSLRHRNVWTYDDRGNWVSAATYKPDGSFVTHFKMKFSYDPDGNVVETINYRADGSVKNKETFTYEFDDYGNWIRKDIRREVFTGDESKVEREVNYRRITYFGEARLATAR